MHIKHHYAATTLAVVFLVAMVALVASKYQFANNQVSSTTGVLSTYQNAQNALSNKASTLAQNVSTLSSKLTSSNATIQADANEIASLQSELSAAESKVSSLSTDAAAISSMNASLQMYKSFYASQISTISAQLTQIASLNSAVGSLTNTIANLETPTNTNASSFFLLNNPMSSFVWFGTNPGSNSSGKVNSWGESSVYNTTWAMCPYSTSHCELPILGNQPAGMIFQFLNKNTIATNFLVYSLETGPNNQSGMSNPGYMIFTKTANNGGIQEWTGSAITGSAMDNNTVFGYVNFTGTLYFNGTPSGSSLINGTLFQYGYSYPKWNKAFSYYFPNTVKVGNGDYLGIVSLNYLSNVDLNSTQLKALVNTTKFPIITTYNGSKI